MTTTSTIQADPRTSLPALRDAIGETLERLARVLEQRVPDPLSSRPRDADDGTDAETLGLQRAVRFLGQLASEWQHVSQEVVPQNAAGLGSTLELEDVESGMRETCTLMTGALLDIDAGQVSLASPMGQALLGAVPGMTVTVRAPQRSRTLRVVRLRTLYDYIQHELASTG